MDDSTQFDFGVLGEVLERDLGTIADQPNYDTPPLGRYKFFVSGGPKTIKTKDGDVPAIALAYKILEVKELKDEADQAFFEGKKGDQVFSEAFMISADPEKLEYTLSAMKARFEAVSTALGITSLKELMTTVCKGIIVEGTVRHRKDKTDPTKFYPDVREVVLSS